MKYPPLGWPPPKLRDLLDELVVYVICPSEWCKTLTLVYSTTCRIHRLMGRKSEKNLAKRVLLGCFGIRDLGKFNKYQQRLGNMTLSLQVTIQLHRPVYSVSHIRINRANHIISTSTQSCWHWFTAGHSLKMRIPILNSQESWKATCLTRKARRKKLLTRNPRPKDLAQVRWGNQPEPSLLFKGWSLRRIARGNLTRQR